MYETNNNFGAAQQYYGDPSLINAAPVWNPAQFINPIQAAPVAPSESITTPEEVALLNHTNEISYEIRPETMAKTLCDHKADKKFIAQVNPETGLFFCPRCGKHFRIMNKGEDIQTFIDSLDTAFETIKLLNTGLPTAAIRTLGTAVAVVDQTLKPIYESVYDGWDRLQAMSMANTVVPMAPNYIGNTAVALNNIRMNPAAYQPTPAYAPSQYAPTAAVPQVPTGNPWDNGGVVGAPTTPYTPNPFGATVAPANTTFYAPYQQQPIASAPAAVTNITANPVIPGATAPITVPPVQPGASGPAQAPQPPVAPSGTN